MQEKSLINIHVPFAAASSPQLHLGLAACRLTVRPGENQAWVTGTYDDLEGSLPLRVQESSSGVSIVQHETLAESLRLEPRLAPLDIALGKGQPFGLAIESGLLEGSMDFSGLPLTDLNVKHSQGRLEILFSAFNPQPLNALNLFVAAGRLEARGLANANFNKLSVEGGEANCVFDFSGKLRRAAQGSISIPQGSVEILVPPEIPACVKLESLTGVIDVGHGFTKKSGAFWTQAGQAGHAPLLTLKVSVLMGDLHLLSG